MNKLYSIYCILIGLLLVFTYSCSDQLSIAPTSSVGVSGFWSSPEDVDGGVTAMYHRLRSYNQNLYMLGSSRSEEMAQSQLRNASWKVKYFNNTLSANLADMDWQTPYKVIGLANLVIKNAPEIEFADENRKNRNLAEAYSMRAFMYYVLARAWGDVPLITEPVEGYDPETTFKERAPVDQIFDLIKSDIEQALTLFPDNQFPEGRAIWSKPALNTLKGDVYLWTAKRMGGGEQDFTSALEALNDAVDSDVQLLDNFSEIFDFNNKGNQEIILAIHFNSTEGGDNHYLRMYAEASVINESNQETIARLAPGGGGGAGWWGASEHIRNQFDDNDTRKEASFYEIFHYDEEGDSSLVAVPVVKYKGVAVAGERRGIDDIVLYRYADLLLMIAEAKNALGQDPTTEINMVRERAYDDSYSPDKVFVSGTKEENDEAILKERQLELAFEGKRWWDLLRFGKAYELVPSLQDKDIPLLWPLDEETLTRNSRLTQTPGY